MEAEAAHMSLCNTVKAGTLALAIQERRDRMVAREDRKSRQDHPRASSVGVCAREVYHQIVDGKLQPDKPVELLHRFKRGREVERLAILSLLNDGFDITENQIPFEIEEPMGEALWKRVGGLTGSLVICTGHTDGRIAWQGDSPVFEIKSLNANVWGRIETARDFLTMGSFWVKYPRQMLLYLYQAAEPYGLFILDDCLGHWKILPVVLDDWLDECEDALQVCRAAAIAARTGEPPPFHNDPSWCLECWARKAGVCHPPLDFTPEKFVEIHSDITAYRLDGMEKDRSAYLEYSSRDKVVKELMKVYGPGRYMAGDWLITCETKGGKFYTKWQRIEDAKGTPDA